MRLSGSDSALLALFALLATGSVALKAAAGPAPDGTYDVRAGAVENELQTRLRGQGFATRLEAKSNRSPVVWGRRGSCDLAVRDARGGATYEALFASDARTAGQVRYLYRGRSSATAPTFAWRIGRLENEIAGRAGLKKTIDIPIALASSPGCGADKLGLENIRVPS